MGLQHPNARASPRAAGSSSGASAAILLGMSYVEISKPRPHVSVITLNRPERLNALSFDTVVPLHDAILEVGADNDAWAVVLTGAGRGFCSGLDLEDHGVPPGIAGLPMSRIATRAMAVFSDLVPAMRNIPQPIIGAINGPSYGGGLCLAAACDIRLGAESASFCGAGIKNGLTGTELGVSWILPRMLGAAHAFELILTGREVDAREAERIGLVSRVVPDAQLLGRRARRRGRDLRAQPARRRDDQARAVVESRDREPPRRDGSGDAQPAAGAHDHQQPRRGDPRPPRGAQAEVRRLIPWHRDPGPRPALGLCHPAPRLETASEQQQGDPQVRLEERDRVHQHPCSRNSSPWSATTTTTECPRKPFSASAAMGLYGRDSAAAASRSRAKSRVEAGLAKKCWLPAWMSRKQRWSGPSRSAVVPASR